jgi:hypothetical protein
MGNIFKEFLNVKKITLIKDGEKTIIACDCITSENHQFLSEATEFEIEDGSNISDHVINRSKVLTIEGIVSDDPITILDTSIIERTISSTTPSMIKSMMPFGLSGEKGKPSKEAFDQFELIHDRKIPVTIITGLKKYDNMIMEEFIAPRSSATVRSLNFTASFRQLRIVSTILEAPPATKQVVELGAQKKKNVGTQGANSIVESRNESWAHAFKGWAVEGYSKIFPGK